MEVGKTVLALNLIDTELDLSESVLVVLVEIGERKFKDSALERVVGVLCSKTRTLDQFLDFFLLDQESMDSNVLNPEDRLTRVFPTFRVSNMEGALRSYQSEIIESESASCSHLRERHRRDLPLRVKGSTTRFLIPFLPLERRLFLPTAVDTQ